MSMTTQPILSVLTTAYNREKFVADAIQSVLASSFTDFELIVVDDCSTDRTVEIARDFEAKDSRVRVYANEKNLGDYPNRNKAASYARGKYIKYLDSDDMMYPHGLGFMVNSMEQFPAAGFGLASRADDHRCYPVCISPAEIFMENFKGYGHFYRAPGSSIMKREVFEKEGGFSGERMIGDLDLWLRLAKKYPMVKFPFDLYWCRHHEGRELVSADAENIYTARVNQLIQKSLESIECPLSETQKKEVEKIRRAKRNRDNIVKNLKRSAGFFGWKW